MGEDKLDAPPKPIVIGSAVMAPATSTTDSAAPRRVERSGSSVWGAMSPELLDAFEQLEITLKTRPNHFFLTLCADFCVGYSDSDGHLFRRCFLRRCRRHLLHIVCVGCDHGPRGRCPVHFLVNPARSSAEKHPCGGRSGIGATSEMDGGVRDPCGLHRRHSWRG